MVKLGGVSAKTDLRESHTVKANYVPVGLSIRIYAVSSMTELPATFLLRPAHTTLPQIISFASYLKNVALSIAFYGKPELYL